MIDFKPIYVTVDDFNKYWNMNLRETLLSYGNDSYAAEKFLFQTEVKLMAWINANANKNHINVITIDKSTWVATFHTSDIAV